MFGSSQNIGQTVKWSRLTFRFSGVRCHVSAAGTWCHCSLWVPSRTFCPEACRFSRGERDDVFGLVFQISVLDLHLNRKSHAATRLVSLGAVREDRLCGLDPGTSRSAGAGPNAGKSSCKAECAGAECARAGKQSSASSKCQPRHVSTCTVIKN